MMTASNRPLRRRATAFAPASLSNLGPGFDALGCAIEGYGDQVEVRLRDDGRLNVSFDEASSVYGLPTGVAQNTAVHAVDWVFRHFGWTGGADVLIRKGIRPGSGLGSSSASAVAGMAAAAHLFAPMEESDRVEAVLAGESIASGSRHGDNVLPTLFGGMVSVSPTNPTVYRHVTTPPGLHLAVLFPDVQILTKQARAILPKSVPLSLAAQNWSALAFLVSAWQAGDWDVVGRMIMEDQIVEPVRASLLPCYGAVKQAALDAGALGCALSGSGPSMFSVCDTALAAQRLADVMLEACNDLGIGGISFASAPNMTGVRAQAIMSE